MLSVGHPRVARRMMRWQAPPYLPRSHRDSSNRSSFRRDTKFTPRGSAYIRGQYAAIMTRSTRTTIRSPCEQVHVSPTSRFGRVDVFVSLRAAVALANQGLERR